jgi:hypothetical protein
LSESLTLEISEFDRDDEELLSPYAEPYRLENWPLEDLIAYVGGPYAKEAYSN